MAQLPGPRASDRQIQYLLALVQGAGHSGFSDARRSLGLSQRQGRGSFTVSEASELIDRLLAEGISPARQDRSAGRASAEGRPRERAGNDRAPNDQARNDRVDARAAGRPSDANERTRWKVFGARRADDPVGDPIAGPIGDFVGDPSLVGPQVRAADPAGLRPTLAHWSDASLADELRRRGWVLQPPPDPF